MCSWSSRKISMILLIFIHLSSSVNALDNPSWCTSNGNYTRSSTYSANLNTLLSSLSSNMTDYGYYTSSVGQSPNTANGLALCRADRTLDECRACVESATREVLQLCPNQKQAVIWHEYCTVRYSNDSIHSEQTISNNIKIIIINSQNASDGNRLREARARLLVDLTAQAVSGTSKLKVGVGMKSYSNWTIYGLAQCKPDFSLENCRLCLTRISQGWESYVSLGIRLLVPGCNIRYEPLGFYNETRLMEQRVLFPQPSPLPPQPPPPPPPPSPSPSPSPSLPPSGISDDNSNAKPRMKVIIIIVVVVGVTLIFGACGIIFMRKRKKQRAYEMTEIDISTVKSLQYDFSRIRAATNDFDNTNKLGEGGFGAVYKGRLHTGDEVAVKRLSKNSGQGNTEFKNEVLLVAKLQHKNLVRLLGFSMEGIERVLIYEFVQNASLDQFIFDPIKGSLLDWVTRYRIIVGIAKGVLYLHEDSRLKIIHRDLKASNILLDGNMNPKISDFGMARLFKQDESQANTNKIVGTYGYMAPEYAMHGEFSIKSDVFSFGVLVLEIIGGKRNTCKRYSDHVEDLLTITWKNWLDGTAEMIIDPVLRNESGPARDMVRCIHVGLLCVQENAAKRPTMASVVQMLGSSTINLPIPCEPAFYMSSPMHTRETGGSEGSRPTQNNVSITELHPR